MGKRAGVLFSAGVCIVCYFIFLFFSRIYIYTDNITIAVVVNGLYGGNTFCQHLHPFLCAFLSVLKKILPAADVYTLTIHLFLFITLISDVYISYEAKIQRKCSSSLFVNRAVYYLCIGFSALFFSTMLNIWNFYYTVQAGFFSFSAGIILFYAKRKEKKASWIIVGTIIACFGVMLRKEAAMLFIPFIILEILTSFIVSNDRKTEAQSIRKYYMPCLIIVIILVGSRHLFYSIEPNKSALKYEVYRSTAGDYPMKNYDDLDDEYKDKIERTEYNAVVNWVLADTEVLNLEKIQEIAEAGRTVKKYDSWGKMIEEMWHNCFAEESLPYMVLITIVLLLISISTALDWRLRLEALMAATGAFVILQYFTWRGRALPRVWDCVLLAVDMISLTILEKSSKQEACTKQKVDSGDKLPELGQCRMVESSFFGNKAMTLVFRLVKIVLSSALCVILFWGVYQNLSKAQPHLPRTVLTAAEEVGDQGYEKTFEKTGDEGESPLYIWPVWSHTIPRYYKGSDILPSQRVIRHNIPLGDWIYGQPYFSSFLEGVHASNPVKALLERENTYLMGVEKVEDFVLEYMRDHYGKDIMLQETGEINGTKAYRIIRN